MKLARSILERLESASEVMAQDVAHVHDLVKGGGFFASILSFILGTTGAAKKRRRTKSED